MKFEKALKDIESLIGKELCSINPQTAPITLVGINYSDQQYIIKPAKGRIIKRPIAELEKIWRALEVEGAVNVEVVLAGAGSSRQQPETIFANLPYIDFFKYQKRKHLCLKGEKTHEFGTIRELSPSEGRQIKRILDNQFNFDRKGFTVSFEKTLTAINKSLDEIKTKYPGEYSESQLNSSLEKLGDLLKECQGTILWREQDVIDATYIQTSIEGDLDAPENTGYEDGNVDGYEDDDSSVKETNVVTELAPARVRYVSPMFSLLFDRMKFEEIELQPEFQRRDRIWNLKQKCALVESILMGLPLPNLYFAERDNGDWVVVDGLQRLTTLKDYMEGKFLLNDLQVLDLEGLGFSDLNRYYQRKFREYTLHCHVISMPNDDDSMIKELFHRINTYGVSLSYQEIRCALYPGSSVKFLRFIAEDQSFRDTTFKKISPKRMKDMEFVLGAVAFILFGYKNYSHERFDSFLGSAMKELNRHKITIRGDFITSQDVPEEQAILPSFDNSNTSQIYNLIKEKMEKAFFIAEEIFGVNRYIKERGNTGRTVISKPLFELIISSFSALSNSQMQLLLERKEIFKDEFDRLLSGERKASIDWISEKFQEEGRDFMYSISQSTGKRVTILYRFQNFQSLIEDVIGLPVDMSGMVKSND